MCHSLANFFNHRRSTQTLPLYTEFQPPPPPDTLPTPSITVYDQDGLVKALLNNEPIIAIASHMVLTGGSVEVRGTPRRV